MSRMHSERTNLLWTDLLLDPLHAFMLALCQYDLHAFDLNEEEKQNVFYTSQLTNINKDSEDQNLKPASIAWFLHDGRSVNTIGGAIYINDHALMRGQSPIISWGASLRARRRRGRRARSRRRRVWCCRRPRRRPRARRPPRRARRRRRPGACPRACAAGRRR